MAEFRQGCVATEDYEAFLRGPAFAACERDSAAFLATNAAVLAPYKRRWVGDPLHGWSRAWEYPFVAHWLEGPLRAVAEPRVLDAGSGITFFPYLLAARHSGARIDCVDQDAYLGELFAGMRHAGAERVGFRAASLQSTGLPAASYDAIYCISVLEHTRNYDEIVDEFHRLLKPGGRLVVTVDISLDGRSDIPLPRLRGLLDGLARRFRALDPSAVERLITLDTRAAGLVTTDYVRQSRPEWLPWKFPRLSGALASLKQGGLPHFAAKQLTFACLVYESQ